MTTKKGTADIVVLRKNTEALSTASYANCIQNRLPNNIVHHARTPTQEKELISTATVATGTGISKELLSYAEELKLFIVASSGYNHLPMKELKNNNVTVINGAGIHAPGIAEQAIGYCLMFARRLNEGIERHRNEEWRHYQASEFNGSTVTIVGLGSIGSTIVDYLQGFNVNTIGVRYTPSKGGPTDSVIGFDEAEFHEALSRTDYLILSTPLSETTMNLISEQELDTLPPRAVIINVSRGGVVNTNHLVSALQKGDVAAAALDVTDPEPLPVGHPLWKMRNVLITPHMGGHTPKHWDRLADIVSKNVQTLEAGDNNFTNVVGRPKANENNRSTAAATKK